MKNWQCFGRFLGRGRRGDESEQKAKREGLFLIALSLDMCIQFHLIMFFFIVLAFSLTDYGDPKYIYWSAVTVLIPNIHQSQTRCGWNILLYRTDTNWYSLTLCFPLLNTDVEWRPLITKHRLLCTLVAAKAALCPLTADVMITCSKHQWDDGQGNNMK